jgi:hypothetical protein
MRGEERAVAANLDEATDRVTDRVTEPVRDATNRS